MTFDAAHAPSGVDHVDDKFVLLQIGGGEGLQELALEGVVLGLFLGGEDDVTGVEAMLERVGGGLLLAGFGFGAFGSGTVFGGGFGATVVGLGARVDVVVSGAEMFSIAHPEWQRDPGFRHGWSCGD